jgi:hypothetical protein
LQKLQGKGTVEILLATEAVFTNIAEGTGEGNSIHLATTSACRTSLEKEICANGIFGPKMQKADIFSKAN